MGIIRPPRTRCYLRPGRAAVVATGLYLVLSATSLRAGFAILFGVSGILPLITGSVVLLRFLLMPAVPGE